MAGPDLEHYKVQCLIHIYFPAIEPALLKTHEDEQAGLRALQEPVLHFSADLLSKVVALQAARTQLFKVVVKHAATINRPLWARLRK